MKIDFKASQTIRSERKKCVVEKKKKLYNQRLRIIYIYIYIYIYIIFNKLLVF